MNSAAGMLRTSNISVVISGTPGGGGTTASRASTTKRVVLCAASSMSSARTGRARTARPASCRRDRGQRRDRPSPQPAPRRPRCRRARAARCSTPPAAAAPDPSACGWLSASRTMPSRALPGTPSRQWRTRTKCSPVIDSPDSGNRKVNVGNAPVQRVLDRDHRLHRPPRLHRLERLLEREARQRRTVRKCLAHRLMRIGPRRTLERDGARGISRRRRRASCRQAPEPARHSYPSAAR